MEFPKLFWPVYLKDGILYMLDETAIPQEVSYLQLMDYKDVVGAIRDMKTRAFGQVLAVMYALEMVILQNKDKNKSEILKIIKEASSAFENSRPTFPFKDITRRIIFWSYEAMDKNLPLGDYIIRNIEGFLNGIKMARVGRAKMIASFINDNSTVLTHCNVSGELVLAGQFAKESGKNVKFICTETRPYLQGARLTAWELKEAGFDVTLIADNAVGNVISKGMIDMVVVGSDRLAQNGDFANKIGTYPIAVLAKEYHVPFYALVQDPSANETGDSIPIEERDENEVLEFRGKRIGPLGARAYYPGFDITKKDLVTKFISLRG